MKRHPDTIMAGVIALVWIGAAAIFILAIAEGWLKPVWS